jgi:hypothetical protein
MKKIWLSIMLAFFAIMMTRQGSATTMVYFSPQAAAQKRPIKVLNWTPDAFQLAIIKLCSPDNKLNEKSSDWLEVSGAVQAFDNLQPEQAPVGFETEGSSFGNLQGILGFGVKTDFDSAFNVGAEYRPNTTDQLVTTRFYGSTLGEITINESDVLLGKIYFSPSLLAGSRISVGFGGQYTELDGHLGLGGFNFQTDGAGWSPVLQLGADVKLNRFWFVGAAYEWTAVSVRTQIPGATDILFSDNGRLLIRATFVFSEINTLFRK